MQIHLWRGEREATEVLLTPENDMSKAPPPSTGGQWIHHGTLSRTRHSTEPLPGGVSWEELNACFSFEGYWKGLSE